MRRMFTSQFLRQTLERAIKTAAQSAILVFGVGEVNALEVDWGDVVGFGAGGFILSVLTSLVTANVGPKDTPSVV